MLVVFAPVLPVAHWLATATSSQSSRAASVLFVTAAAGGLVAALAHADRHGLFPFDGRERRIAVGVYTALGALLVVGFLVVASGRPDTWLRHRYDEFSTIKPPSVAPVVITGTHYDTASSDRYDYWRVALHAFADHPVGGVGAGAFATPWYRLRVAVEDVNDPHSWIAQALSETGVIGLLLLGAGLLLPFRRARGARGLPPERHVAVVTLTGTSVYFVAHAASDWTLRIPAVAIAGMLALGALAAAGDTPLRLPGRRFRIGGLAVGLLVAAVAAMPYLSTRELILGERDANDRTAIDKLRLAADLNPFSIEPLIVESGVWLDAGDKRKAVQVAREAVDRNPDSWVAWENLSQIGSLAGSHDILVNAHRRAVQLNPYLATRPNG